MNILLLKGLPVVKDVQVVNQQFIIRGGGRVVKAVDCKSTGKPSLVRIQSTPVIAFFFIKKKKKKKIFFQKPRFFFFKKNKFFMLFLFRAKKIKNSFIYLYLLSKRVANASLPFGFFFYNDLYFFFFKKIAYLIQIRYEDLFFVADLASNSIANISDLNFIILKKNYIYDSLLKRVPDLSMLIFLQKKLNFFFIRNLTERLLSHQSALFSAGCGLTPVAVKPDIYGFYLPVILDYNFSLFFYKFFLFSLLNSF